MPAIMILLIVFNGEVATTTAEFDSVAACKFAKERVLLELEVKKTLRANTAAWITCSPKRLLSIKLPLTDSHIGD